MEPTWQHRPLYCVAAAFSQFMGPPGTSAHPAHGSAGGLKKWQSNIVSAEREATVASRNYGVRLVVSLVQAQHSEA